jgi:hypothetical protein
MAGPLDHAVTSPLVPWNSSTALMGAVLGVATISYLAFADRREGKPDSAETDQRLLHAYAIQPNGTAQLLKACRTSCQIP